MSTGSSLTKLDRIDGLLLALVAVFVVGYTLATFAFSAVPFEDAAILMRFADHMAQGHGIIWNLGEKPVDGATDFLFLVTLGFLGMAGIDIHHGVLIVGIGSHWILCLFVYWAIRRLHGAPRWMAVLSATYLAIGPALRQVEAYFGAPYFALFAATTFYLAYLVFLDEDKPSTAPLFALSSLVLGLIRPEGVFLSAFILFSVLWVRGWSRCRRMVLNYLIIFGGLGATYFLWRWSYFGYPLPNPFYVKGGGSLYPFSLIGSCQNVIRLTLPFLPIVGYAVAVSSARLINSPERRKYATLFVGIGLVAWLFALLTALEGGDKEDLSRPIGVRWALVIGALWIVGPFALARAVPAWFAGPKFGDRQRDRVVEEPIFAFFPVFAFTFLWILLSAMMNYLERFQYAALPLVLMSCPAMLMGLVRTGFLPRVEAAPLRAALLAVFFGFAFWHFGTRYPAIRVAHDGTYDVAVMLAEYGGPENTIVVTNAGHLPYYSGWRAVDAWGLSDQKIAHEGLTREYVAAQRADVIQFDAPFSPPETANADYVGWSWYEAVVLLSDYARSEGYVLASAYGLDRSKAHHYYVRSDWEHCAEVVERIRGIEYHWHVPPGWPGEQPIAKDHR